ncbi:hypothetical protein MICRO8M_90082 [Microbacterium sp. 8M]|nr:hypothetical protein MICRO8M_90082 [Microbacterium sp. 8M]
MYEAGNYGVVTGKNTNGTNAGFLVLRDASAASTYRFTIGDPGTTLRLNDDGTVTVLNANGQFVNYLSAPWARDANNRDLPTSYSVEGNNITQHIDTTGAAFPVVADPSSECGVGWCSAYFNRTETKQIAAGGPLAATLISGACVAINPWAGLGCAIATGGVVGMAIAADSTGDCIGLFFTPVGSNPFIEPRGTAHCY